MTEKKNKVKNLLSMAQRAGKLVSGDFIVEREIKRKKVSLLFMASDIANNNKKKYEELSSAFMIPTYSLFTKDELGQIIGKARRVIVAVEDHGFAKTLLKILD